MVNVGVIELEHLIVMTCLLAIAEADPGLS